MTALAAPMERAIELDLRAGHKVSLGGGAVKGRARVS